MKCIEVEFVALERKYQWSYADNDKSAVDWLLQLSCKHDIEIRVIEGFKTEEIEILKNHKNFRKMRRPAVDDLMNHLNAA